MENINQIDKNNLTNLLAGFIEKNNLEIKEVAKEINCSISTIKRLIAQETLPTERMIKQVGIMISIGFEKYKKLSKSEKEKISETIGVVSGGALGFGVITAAVSAAGSVAGLSAAGITSGLAAIGAVVGGGMAAGIFVACGIPFAGVSIGYGIVKGIKMLIKKHKLNNNDIDNAWEELKNS